MNIALIHTLFTVLQLQAKIHALLCRIGQPSNTATSLALFGGRLRIEAHSSSIRTNRTIVLKSSCIRSMTCFPPNRATLAW